MRCKSLCAAHGGVAMLKGRIPMRPGKIMVKEVRDSFVFAICSDLCVSHF